MAETMGYIVICVILQLLPRTLTNVFCSSERLKREQRGTEGSGETGYRKNRSVGEGLPYRSTEEW